MKRRTLGGTPKWRSFTTGYLAGTTARGTSRARLFATELTLAGMMILAPSAPAIFAYDFQKSITIDRSKIAGTCGATLTHYPMLFSVTDPDLANTPTGDVTDPEGDDIIFVGLDAATCGGPVSCVLDHEIERYVNTTGELVAWVRIPAVNTNAAVSDTVIYVRYGDSGVTTPTENPNSVWDASYQGVWHLAETGGGVADEYVDSSGTGNHGQGGSGDGGKTPAQSTSGRIGNAQDFDGADDFIDLGNSATLAPSSITVSAWAKREGSADAQAWQDILGSQDFNNAGFLLNLVPEATGVQWRTHSSGAYDDATATLTTSEWHLYTGTFTGTTSRVYVDGALQDTNASAAMAASTQGVAIGDDWVGGLNGQFDGLIDEVRISSTARSACWIGGEFANQDDPGDIGAPGFYAIGAAEATTWSPPTFTTAGTGDGIIIWDGGTGDDGGWGVTIQDNGKVLVSGRSHTGSDHDFALWRYNADGTLDTSFGSGAGYVTTDFSSTEDYGLNVEVLADDKILVSGISNNDFALVRYQGDASLDTGFGTGGKVTTSINATDVVSRMVIQPDGKILLLGYTNAGSNDWAIVRYNNDGSVDTGFGTLGVVTADWNGGGNDLGQDILLQPDGKILISGRGPAAPPEGDGTYSTFNIARYNTDGSLDTSFGVVGGGTDGFNAFDVAAGHDFAFGLALQLDGKILQVGMQNTTNEMLLARWNSDGTVDTSFGGGSGFVSINAGTNILNGRDVHVQGDGKFVVTGYSHNGTDYDLSVVRLNTDGSLDTSFDTDGFVITPILSAMDYGIDSAVTPDGHILVVGKADNGTNDDLVFVRYNSDGTLDTEWDGATTLDGSPTFVEGDSAVVLDADVNVRDADLDALNGGNGDYAGADLVLERLGGPNAEDVFDFVDGNGITRIGTSLFKSGSMIATFIDIVPGRLTMSFVNAGQIPTSADVDNILRQITYANSSSSPPSSVQINWTFNDDVGLETTGATTVTISGTYDFFKPITIDRGQISDASCGTTLTSFPMLFKSTDPDLRHTSFGGDVTDLQGDDIIFRGGDAATCGAAPPCTLDHEIEKYVYTTGELVAWVRIPSLNTNDPGNTSDTVIYMFYGNSTVTTPTENPTGVWDAGYQGVWHLGEGDSTAVDFYQDSTINNEDGTLTDANGNSTAVAGQIGGAYDFSGDADQIDIPNFSQYLTTAMTISGWVKPPAPHADHDGYFGIRNGDVDHSFYALQLANTSDLELRFRNSVGGVYEASVASAVSAGAWVHVALTYDGSNLISYVDGQFASQDPTATGSFSSSTHTFSIGAVGGNPLDGTVDEVRVSSTARSACWIAASHNNQAWPDKAVTPTPDPSPNPSEGFYGVGAPTAVELVSFTARGLDEAVELQWETGSELENLGFHLYRSLSASGPWERITSSLIPGLGSSPAGARYRYVDTGLANDVPYFYELEDIETAGKTKRHGPVSAIATEGGASEEAEVPVEDEGSESVITYGDPVANHLRVLNRDRYQVILELTTEGFLAYPEPGGSVRIEIPDYFEVGDNGLPKKRTWVEALAGRQVELVSIREQDVETIGLRPAGTENEIVATPDGVVRLRRRTRPRAKRTNSKGVVPPEAARLVSVAFQGEVKKALVEMAPLRWDASRQQIRLAKKLIVTLSFAKRDRNEVVSPDGRRGRLSRRRGKEHVRGGVVARLGTRAPGLYAVRYEEIFGRRSRRGMDAERLRLSRLGERVAYHLEPVSSRFGPGSTLYFVSPGADANPYGDEAVFELEVGGSGGAVMSVQNVSPSGAITSSYLRRDEHEENHLYQATLSETEEHWMWDMLFAPARKGYRFSASALAPVTEPSRLELRLQGGSDFPESPDHHVVVTLNGTMVTERSWDGKVPQELDVDLGPGVLGEGDNLLEIENVGDTGAAYSMVFVDRYAVTYPRFAIAEGGVLEGRWTESGTAEVSGVSSRASLVDTTRARPVWLAGASSSGDDVLRFRAEAEHRYLVVGQDQVLRSEVREASPAWLKRDSNRADTIVLGPRAFLDAARPLVEHRRRQGLTPLAVPVEQVYAEFGFGEPRPEAIREFLSYAYHNWKAPSLRYVLLLGDATYDFKNDYGLNVDNHVPPLLIETRYLQTVSDPTYAAVNGDDSLPDVAIGRLPAASIDEVRVMVEKILAYETGEASLGAALILVSDNPDKAGDFDADAEELATTVLASNAPRHLSLEKLGTAATRQAVLDAFDDGASVVSYIGHGGIQIWADESLLESSSVATLSPQPQQPLVLTMNCLNGYFHFPFFNSLSEELVKAEGKGAIAAFSPSGMSLNQPAHLYHRALLNELFHGSHLRLGDAVLAAQEAYAETGAYPELLSVYHLLGDPALTIR